MYVRIVRGQVQPGQADELARRWKEYFSGVRQQGGAGPRPRSSYIAVDRAANATLGVSTWDEQPDEAAIAPITEGFRERVRDLMAGPPTFETYEVVAEL